MTTYVTNAFALSMLPPQDRYVLVERKTPEQVAKILREFDFVSCIGHADLAAVVSQQLGITVVPNRVNVQLGPNDLMYVAQYMGPRLPEGTTELPEGARIQWFYVTLE